jgi:hypothetical protein
LLPPVVLVPVPHAVDNRPRANTKAITGKRAARHFIESPSNVRLPITQAFGRQNFAPPPGEWFATSDEPAASALYSSRELFRFEVVVQSS